MRKFTIFRNYGVLRAEKRYVYTYGAPAVSGVCSDEIQVHLPDDCGWELFENNFGRTMIKAPWGDTYGLNDVLHGNENPCLSAFDRNFREHRVYLVIDEE